VSRTLVQVSAQSVQGEAGSPDAGPGEAGGSAGPRTRGFSARRLVVTLVLAGVIVGLVRVFLIQTFVIPSGSMEPGLQVGDRVVVSRLDYRFGSVQRGDVVVFDGDGVFADAEPPGSLLARVGRGVARAFGNPVGETDFVKRVIGVAGDHVVCCDSRGRITVNGRALDEPYVYPGDAPSETPFDVTVPAGKLWMMGDHRSSSADSRDHLGDPGGGMVPVDSVVGRVVAVWWPWDRATGVGRPATPASASAPPAGTGVLTEIGPRAARPGREGTP
jgi:signal peptidase I